VGQSVHRGPGPRMTRAVKGEIRSRIAAGATRQVVADALGLCSMSVYRVLREAGPVPPRWTDRAPGQLSLAQREEISLALAAGESLRAIARSLAVAPSTISREVASNGGRAGYRAWRADEAAYERARRDKPRKIETNQCLLDEINRGLAKRWSPKQIAARLEQDFPDDPEMRVSHETIYQALFLQAKGKLKVEVTKSLRAGRFVRRPHGRTADGRGRVKDMVMISDRPAEIEDRAVPGHWEGDLIIGKNNGSSIATLVERSTRFVMLVKIERATAEAVCAALTAKILTLPLELRRSVTWDQGKEMAHHLKFTIATDVAVYFCDPHSPWQRGTNENTNGLLREYFPKGTDLSIHTQQHLDNIAAELNDRPRQTLGWMKPSEKFTELLR
jgi:IS30 family transposase